MPSYETIVRRMKSRFSLRVRKWRRQMSGCAWRVRYGDGRTINWVEAPRPRTPISLAIFLHEVGHHAIGFDGGLPRCEEEYRVWGWTLDAMHDLGVRPDGRVMRRVELSMQYALRKAIRRGLKTVPRELRRFLPAA
jgi:hypothetical protein